MKFLTRLFAAQQDKELPTLQAIYIARSAGEAMQSVNHTEAVEQAGLLGDRYCTGRGFWKVTEACQVTLISTYDLGMAKKRLLHEQQEKLHSGHHRRNLVVSGINTRHLQDKTFSIGEAQFCYVKPRPPCGYLDKVEGKGLGRALGKHSGVCLSVVRGGIIKVGDNLAIIDD